MRKLYLHPGLPKTGSSYLESAVFPQLNNEACKYNLTELVDLCREICDGNTTQATQAALEEHLKSSEYQSYVISYDALCGDPYASFLNCEEVVTRLAAHLNDFDVSALIVTRIQSKWIESIFKQSLHEYYYTPFKRFLRWDDNDEVQIYPSVIVDALDWVRIIATYEKAFGEKNVTVLPYELLAENENSFLKELEVFFNTTLEAPNKRGQIKNRGYGAISCKISLILNPLLREKSPYGFLPNRPFYYFLKKRLHNPIYYRLFKFSAKFSLRYFLQQVVDKYFWSKPSILSEKEHQKVMVCLAEKNKKLGTRNNIDFKEFGYF